MSSDLPEPACRPLEQSIICVTGHEKPVLLQGARRRFQHVTISCDEGTNSGLTGSDLIHRSNPDMANAAEILVDTLIAWNVEVVFGLPGDGINGVMEALRTRQDKIAFVQVRHEESAAFMACAYAKWTGKLGVCLATSGPGGTHLLTGLYDAKLDQAPVLAITGMQFHDLIETFTQQDVDLTRVFNDVTVFNAQVNGAAHMENMASLACRSALSKRGVAHLSISNDVQEESLDESDRSKRNQPGHEPNQWFDGLRLPHPP